MQVSRVVCGALVLVGVMLTSLEALGGDAAIGAGVFENRCKECHEAPPDSRKAGPSLVGIVGRPAGTLAGFNYSEAMRAAGFVWSVDQLRAYLANPKAVVPGNRMLFNGLKRAGEADNLIAYLQSISE